MKILLITQWFDPEPTAKGSLFARRLADLGNEVTVVTGFPNYPTGRVYPGYRVRLCQKSLEGPVRVLRVPLYPSHDTSPARRLINYGSFAASSTVATLFVRRADVAYIYHPPGTLGVPALALKLLRDIPFVYDIQDMWPESLAATQMLSNTLVLRAVEAWMQLIYRAATLVVVQSPGFARSLAQKGVPSSKTRMIYNWTFEQDEQASITSGSIPPEFKDSAFHVIYAGNVGKAQQLDVVLEAAKLLNGESPTVTFHVIGDGVDLARLRDLATRQDLNNVVFHGRRSPTEMPALLCHADALLIHLRDDPLFAMTIPSKTQASLLAAKPIIIGVRGDAADLVREAEAGFAFEPISAVQLAAAVKRMAALPLEARQAMGRDGKAFYDAKLAPEVGVQKFAEVLAEADLLHRRASSPSKLRQSAIFAAMVLALQTGHRRRKRRSHGRRHAGCPA